jgi:hypothetical protein
MNSTYDVSQDPEHVVVKLYNHTSLLAFEIDNIHYSIVVGLRSDISEWCKDNLSGPIDVRIKNMPKRTFCLTFANERDAVLFKLRWY